MSSSRTARAWQLAAGCLLVVASLAGTTPAHAHTDLVESAPAAGEHVQGTIDRVRLDFGSTILPGSAEVVVRAANGAAADIGDPEVVGSSVVVPVRLTGAGQHTVAYRVIAADGHPVTGSYSFTARAAAQTSSATLPSIPTSEPPAAAAGPQTTTPEPGARPWTWAIAGAGFAALVLVLHRSGRRGTPS